MYMDECHLGTGRGGRVYVGRDLHTRAGTRVQLLLLLLPSSSTTTTWYQKLLLLLPSIDLLALLASVGRQRERPSGEYLFRFDMYLYGAFFSKSNPPCRASDAGWRVLGFCAVPC